MNQPTTASQIILVLFTWIPFLSVASTHAEEIGSRPITWEPRVPVARSLSPVGTLLINDHPGQPWQSAGPQAELHSRDLLLALPGIEARLETVPRSVELTLWGNLPDLSEFYGLQSGVTLHDSRAFDLDFTLQRGRVIVTNRKDKGAARVWVRIDGAGFQLTLAEPGDAICLGWYSFWPRGARFTLSPRPEDGPASTLNFLVLKGQVDIKAGATHHSLSAPPGPAYYHWDSLNGAETGARHRRQPDPWADPNLKASARAKPLLAVIERYLAMVREKDARTVLFDLLASSAKETQREQVHALAEFAVYGLAAINDLERVLQALEDPRQEDVRKVAVIALRHWIGDAAGRDRRLHAFLVDRLHYGRSQASTVLQLLHTGFPADEPETYETLIAYLGSEKLAIRELAWRQLTRLVPEDILIPYDAAASAEERAKTTAAWRKLIPSGSLPTRKTKG